MGRKDLREITAFLTSNEEELQKAKFHVIIIVVPNPINTNKTPNLDAVIKASRIVGRNLIKGYYGLRIYCLLMNYRRYL